MPNAPSSNTTAPSLSDLDLTPEQTQGNPREQALLDKRTHMLKIHQRMGLITTIPLIATVATSLNAGGKSTSTSSRYLHAALGGVTGDLYFITAYYAIRAPRVPGTETRPEESSSPTALVDGSDLRPEIYAQGRARCPRCRVEFLYDAVLYPWCPGCCDRPA